jgi:hypothetical protein
MDYIVSVPVSRPVFSCRAFPASLAILMNFTSLRFVWQIVPSLNSALQPTRAGVLCALAAPVLFLAVPQGTDILNALGERDGLDGRVATFVVALVFFGLMNWFGPRFLLDCRFGEAARAADVARRFAGAPPGMLAFYQRLEGGLVVHLPRLLGTVPIGLIGMGFVRLWRQHAPPVVSVHGMLALLCFAVAGALYAFFIGRRFVIEARRKRLGVVPRPAHTLRSLVRDPLALLGFSLFLLTAVGLGVVFTGWPVPAGFALGSGAVLLFALGSWACYGAILVYFGHRTHLPTLTLAAALAIVSSFYNDNHAVQTLPGREAPGLRASLTQRLDEWHERVKKNYPVPGKRPFVVVVTEGGGIRAAYWTALVLATLEERAPQRFSDHLFAISGVSGGSLGGATFNVMLGDQDSGPAAARVRTRLSAEFLGPLVGKMTFPDMGQRFIPHPFPILDRARALEDGWADAMKTFDQPFSQFYQSAPGMGRPELFFNGTEVEEGRRIITSTVRDTETPRAFVDALDGVALMEGQVMRLSTAVHASARFTYFSPAGRYPNGTHVVDGGYFENSGSSTAHDLLRALARRPWAGEVFPVVVVITNGPEAVSAAAQAQAERERAELRDSHASHEVMAPLTTLLGTRTAHADHARGDLEAAVDLTRGGRVFHFALVKSATALPLGWSLSPGAIDEMEFEVNPDAMPEKLKACDDLTQAALRRNSAQLRELPLLLPTKP